MSAHGIALPAPRTVADLVREYGGRADYAIASARVSRVAEPEVAQNGDLAVVTSAQRAVLSEGSFPVLVASAVASRVPEGRRFVHEHPMWVVARLLAPLERGPVAAIASEARVATDAEVAPSATVEAGAVVLGGARIGPECVIGVGAVIYGGVTLGARVRVGPNAVIGKPGFGFTPDPEGNLVRIPHLGGVVIEDDVEVGALTTIDAGTLSPTRIERGVKLDAHVHVGHNGHIGAHTLVAAQSGFAGSVRLGSRVLVGGQVGVSDHRTVGDGARLAAGSGVISDVPAGSTVAGYPATRRALWLRTWARLLGGKRERP